MAKKQKPTEKAELYLLDASIYIFRQYFALPDVWHNDKGYSLNAVYGYTRFLLGLLHTVKPEYIVAAYDESLGQCFRNDILPGYKQSRALPDESLAFQLQACRRVSELLGICSLAERRFEADDIIATLAARARRARRKSVIVSRDKDFAQLVCDDKVSIWDPVDDRHIDSAYIESKFGVTPEQWLDYQCLLGDAVDDVPGVPGVGPKTAAALLREFGSLAEMLREPDAVARSSIRGGARLATVLQAHAAQFSSTRQCLRLVPDVNLVAGLPQARWRPVDAEPLRHYLHSIGLGDRLGRDIEKSGAFCATAKT